jgi:hypothetical protein
MIAQKNTQLNIFNKKTIEFGDSFIINNIALCILIYLKRLQKTWDVMKP